MIPVWLLDVDGVLNAGRAGWDGPPRTGTAYDKDGQPFRIRWSADLVKRITALHVSGAVEIWWATTWVDHDPDQISRLLGLPTFPVGWEPQGWAHTLYVRAAKQNAAHHVLRAERRPLIWTDDQAIPDRLIEPGDPPALLIAPDTRRGLRPEHMDRIEQFARQMTRSEDR